jgi:molybdopterin-binding protein
MSSVGAAGEPRARPARRRRNAFGGARFRRRRGPSQGAENRLYLLVCFAVRVAGTVAAPRPAARPVGGGQPPVGTPGAVDFFVACRACRAGDQRAGRRGFRYHRAVPNLRIRQAADLLGVSDDTVRRWINQGTLSVSLDTAGRKVIASEALAEFSRTNAPAPPPDPLSIGSSARNRFVGLVTKVISDKVMTQVEMQCGPHTVVSLMSTEAAQELNLQPGSVAVAVVKATTVIVETARPDTAISSD